MDSKIIESYQCSLESYHTVLIELILNSNLNLALFRKTQNLRSSRHKNLQKQNNEHFLYSCLMIGYISPPTNFLPPHIYKKFLINPYFEVNSLN